MSHFCGQSDYYSDQEDFMSICSMLSAYTMLGVVHVYGVGDMDDLAGTIQVSNEDYSPFVSKAHALLFLIMHSPRPIVCMW